MSPIVSVEVCWSSCWGRIQQLCCRLEVAVTLPRDWSSAEPVGAASTAPSAQPRTSGCPHWTKHKLAVGALGVQPWKAWEAGKLIPWLHVVRWGLEGWKAEWSVSRAERGRERERDVERGEAVLSLQLCVRLRSSWIIDAINYLIRKSRNDYFLLISQGCCPSTLHTL